MNLDLARLNVSIHLTLTLLPPFGPKPFLVDWDREVGTQLDDAVIALDHFDLRAGLVEVVTPTKVSGKRERSPRLDAEVNRHELQCIAALRYCSRAALRPDRAQTCCRMSCSVRTGPAPATSDTTGTEPVEPSDSERSVPMSPPLKKWAPASDISEQLGISPAGAAAGGQTPPDCTPRLRTAHRGYRATSHVAIRPRHTRPAQRVQRASVQF